MKNTKQQILKISKVHIFFVLIMPTFLCCFLIYYSFISSNAQGQEDRWWTFPLILSLILWAILYLWNASRFRIILSDDFIHLKSLFSNQKIRIADLGNYKLDRYGIHIYSKSQTASPLILISVTLTDQHLLQSWLEEHSRYPELDAKIAAYEEDLKGLKENAQYGKNQIEKTENLVQANTIAKWLNEVAWFLFFWVGFGTVSSWNVPFMHLGLGITILIPIALAYFSIRYQGFFKLELESSTENSFSNPSPFPNVSSALVAPIITLWIYWIFERAYLFEPAKVWQYALLVNLLVLLPTLYSARDFSFKKIKDYLPMSLIFLCMFGYSYSSIAYINVYYDSSEANILPVQVLSKRAGKGVKDSDQITLAPWNNYKTPYKIKVPQYYQIEKGDYIFIHLKEGYLGIQHYEIATE